MKEKLLMIINHYGIENQQRKLEEEIFELQQAIIRAECVRYIGIGNDIGETARKSIEEELGDVLNILDEIFVYYDLDINNIFETKEKKINRQQERIKNECNN